MRPPVRNPTLVWVGCHATTGGDSPGDNGVLGFGDPVTGTEQIGHIGSKGRTAKLDLTAAWKSKRSVSHSTTAPMSSTACVSARGTSQKTGRKPPRCGLSWVTFYAGHYPPSNYGPTYPFLGVSDLNTLVDSLLHQMHLMPLT